MVTFTIRRLLASIPVLIGILIVTFVLGRMIPGDPCTAMFGERATEAMCTAFIERKGLDQPIPVQLGIFMRDMVRGDFGSSIRYSRPVMNMVIERLPMTIELSLAAFTLAVLVGVPLGVISAVNRNSPIDVLMMIGANFGVSIPVFWLGLMLAYIFALQLGDTFLELPPSGRLPAGLSSEPFYEVYGWQLTEDTLLYGIAEFISNLYLFNSLITLDFEVFTKAIRHLILPSVALSTIPMAIIARMTRSSVLEVLGLDYIRAARAKGLTKRQVVLKHALRNALLPVVTIMGLQLGGLLAGAVLTETIFQLAGVGRALFEAIGARDYPVIQAFTFVIAVIYLAANLIVDLSYGFLDPRIRLD